jgi:CO/xanthine dehydrogenase Mo-binding subunit
MATVLKTDPSETARPAGDLKWIGTRQLRPDGVDKVTGRARFGADLSLPGMLVGKVLRSPLHLALLKSIDAS